MTNIDPNGLAVCGGACIGGGAAATMWAYRAYRAYRLARDLASPSEASDPTDDARDEAGDDEEGEATGEGGRNCPDFPENPDDLLEEGWEETSHPNAAANGHRTFRNPETGDVVRHDQGRPGANGHEGRDHWHWENPNATGRGDQYLDSAGNPTPRGSGPSHIYPE